MWQRALRRTPVSAFILNRFPSQSRRPLPAQWALTLRCSWLPLPLVRRKILARMIGLCPDVVPTDCAEVDDVCDWLAC